MNKYIAMCFLLGAATLAQAQNMSGQAIYNSVCASCHGEWGQFGSVSPAPLNTLSQAHIEARLKWAREQEPKRAMDRIKSTLNDEQGRQVAEYISTELSKQAKTKNK